MSLTTRFRERGLASKTQAVYLERLEKLDPPAKGASKPDVDAFVDRVEAACAGGDTPLGTALPTRAAAWHHLVGELGVDEDAARRLLPHLRRRDARSRPEATSAQWRRFVQALTERPIPKRTSGQRALLLIAESGLRISEACALTWEQVSFVAEVAMLRVVGKREKVRDVPVAGRSAEMLRSLRGASGPVFPGRGGATLHPNAVRNELARVIAQAPRDFYGELTVHGLRHWFAYAAYNEGGMDLLSLQSILGHESADTTRIYTRPSAARLVEAARDAARRRR